jgi:hypothetical protein
MLLVPLSTDGRVSAVVSTVPAPGPLRVALEPDEDGVGIVALGPGAPRPVGRLGAADAARYGPVLRHLLARSLVGSCPAQVTTRGRWSWTSPPRRTACSGTPRATWCCSRPSGRSP